MLSDYWREKDLKTGETWLSFAQRTGMDAVSIAYGQAWQELIEARSTTVDHEASLSPTPVDHSINPKSSNIYNHKPI